MAASLKCIKKAVLLKAYQLVNHTEFDANGRYVGTKTATPAPVAQPTTESAEV